MRLFLCGDVMLGRGVDQILPHPGDPTLRESYVRDARDYIELTERANGPIDRPVDHSWPWGEALSVLVEASPDVRILNLETAVTSRDDFARGKGIHYRMHPDNLPCLSAADPDVCVLANNHVLDFGRSGLEETLDVLGEADLHTVGAGRDLADAERPAEVPLQEGGRVLVFGLGVASSGIPAPWAATPERSGVHFHERPSPEAAEAVVGLVRDRVRPGDVTVVSVHWGSNWGYEVPEEQTRFAHALIDGGVDVVHGHSSHHPRPIEVYRDRLILYGCGDLINDYEGISGHEGYRDDLRPMYVADVRSDGALAGLRIVPMVARRMRLERASSEDADWLAGALDRVSDPFGTRIVPVGDRELALEGN